MHFAVIHALTNRRKAPRRRRAVLCSAKSEHTSGNEPEECPDECVDHFLFESVVLRTKQVE